MFSVRNCHSDIFLVVRIETVLQGAINASVEPYVKPNVDSKTGLKVQKSARSYSNRYSNSRQSLRTELYLKKKLFHVLGWANIECRLRGPLVRYFAWAVTLTLYQISQTSSAKKFTETRTKICLRFWMISESMSNDVVHKKNISLNNLFAFQTGEDQSIVYHSRLDQS